MPNATKTQADLVGTGGSLTFVGQENPSDSQEFAFPGIDGVYRTSLGGRGAMYRCSGIMRASGSTRQTAANTFKTLLAATLLLKNQGTIFDLFHGESTDIKKLYEDGASADLTNIVIAEFNLVSPRYFTGGGTTNYVVADFEMVLRRVGT